MKTNFKKYLPFSAESPRLEVAAFPMLIISNKRLIKGQGGELVGQRI